MGMNIPDDLRYSADHEWVREVGTRVRIGITDFAQDALGDVVFAQLPAIGTVVAAGDSMGEVESTKSVSDIYAPVAGTITAINEVLNDDPALLNSDPYDAGWICEIELDATLNPGGLLDAEGYRALTEG